MKIQLVIFTHPRRRGKLSRRGHTGKRQGGSGSRGGGGGRYTRVLTVVM